MSSPKVFRIVILLVIVTFLGVAIPTHSQSSIKVSGSVNDEIGGVITSARVSMYSLDRILQEKVDAEGHFHFNNLAAGTYELEAIAEGFQPITRNVAIANQSASFRIVLPVAATHLECGRGDSISYDLQNVAGAASISGVAVDIYSESKSPVATYGKSKPPIANATVSLFRAETKISEQQTNDHGEFDFKGIEPGRYTLMIGHPNYREVRSHVLWVTREDQTRVTFTPIPVGKIVVCG